MKDTFLKKLDEIHLKIYKMVTKVTYWVLVRKRTKHGSDLTKDEKKNIRIFWKKYGINHVPLQEYKWYKKQGLKISEKIIPDILWHSEIEPYFNSYVMEKGFEDKNYFETIIGKENAPTTIVRCINGLLLDNDYRKLNEKDIINILTSKKSVICKPSIDSGGGRGITFLNGESIDTIKINKIIEDYHGNFIVQELVNQHPFFSKFNETALNTMRIVTLLFEGNVYYLSGFLKVGAKGSRLDNVSGGGSYIQIYKNGTLGNKSISENLENHDLVFSNRNVIENEKIPCWDRIWRTVEEMQYKLPHFRLINWDVALSKEGIPIIIEYNLMDSSSYFHQVNCGPIFGDLTDDVLREVFINKRKRN